MNLSLVIICKTVNSNVLEIMDIASWHLSAIELNFQFIVVYASGEIESIKKYSNLTLIQSGLKSPAYSRNLATQFVKSPNFAFLDDDTLVNEEWAYELKNFCEQDCIDAIFFQDASETTPVVHLVPQKIPPLYFADTAGCLIKGYVFEQLQFNEEYIRCEDIEFATKAIRTGYLVKFSKIKLVSLEIESDQQMRDKTQQTIKYKEMLNKEFALDYVGANPKPKASVKSFLTLLKQQKLCTRLEADFFIYNDVFYYGDKDQLNEIHHVKLYRKSKNIKIVEIK